MKIKVKVLTDGCMPVISQNGDWIDLRAAKNMSFSLKETVNYIPLGVAMQLPKGFEAIVASRSSTPKKQGIFIPCGIGIIDNSYSGNNDQWHFIAVPLKNTKINKGDRICQFRIQLSQKATFIQKLKWLFSNKIELVQVNNLNEENRGGLGSTGVN